MAAAFSRERVDGSAVAVGMVMLIVLALALAGAANAVDPAFRTHSFMFAIAATLGLGGLLIPTALDSDLRPLA